MEFVSKGGYSEVFYDHKKKEIYRKTPLFLNSNCSNQKEDEIDTSGISDLIFTKSFEYTGCTPIVHSEMIYDRCVSMRMPYYGLSLHDWINKVGYNERMQHAACIIAQITIACMNFDRNAFYHPDLKPSNIVIETGSLMNKKNIPKIHVIDFNISSVQIINMNSNKKGWSNTIGTWNYCAPEIILNGVPEKNSSSWAIGIIAAIIIDEYPFYDFVNIDMQTNIYTRNEWESLFKNLLKKYPKHPPLSRWQWYDNQWKQLIWNCTHWLSSKRWTLDDIYRYVYNSLLDNNTRMLYTDPDKLYNTIQCIEHPVHISIIGINDNTRTIIIEKLFDVCTKIRKMNIFPTAVSIFDRCGFIIQNSKDPLISNFTGAASILISAFVFDVDILQSDKRMSLVIECFHLQSTDKLMEHVYKILQHLKFRVWEKPAHIFIIDRIGTINDTNVFWKNIKKEFLYFNEYYTQRIIAEHFIENMNSTD